MKKILALFLLALSMNVIALRQIKFKIDNNYIIAKTEDQYHEYFVKKDLKTNKFFGCICCKPVDWRILEGFGGCYPITTLKFPPTGKFYEIESNVSWPVGKILIEAIDAYVK